MRPQAPRAARVAARIPAKYGPRLCQGPGILPWLEPDRFNVVGVANNHFVDQGIGPMNHTLEALGQRGVLYGGIAEGMQALPEPIWLGKGATRIAIVCVAEYSNGCRSYGTLPPGHAWALNPHLPTYLNQLARQASQLWVYVHAGLERYPMPLPQWQAVYRSFIDQGARLVVGHHPHRIQGKETYKDGTIYYSLGNFLFPDAAENDSWHTGILLELDSQPNGEWRIREHYVRYEQQRLRLLQGGEHAGCAAEVQELSSLLATGREQALMEAAVAHCRQHRHYLERYYSFQPFRIRKKYRPEALQRWINALRYAIKPGRAHLVQNDAMLRH
ncbi:MAG: CapA family protein, partial [Sphingobacteriia bacterium]